MPSSQVFFLRLRLLLHFFFRASLNFHHHLCCICSLHSRLKNLRSQYLYHKRICSQQDCTLTFAVCLCVYVVFAHLCSCDYMSWLNVCVCVWFLCLYLRPSCHIRLPECEMPYEGNIRYFLSGFCLHNHLHRL